MSKIMNQDIKHMGCCSTYNVKNKQVNWPTGILNFKLTLALTKSVTVMQKVMTKEAMIKVYGLSGTSNSAI